MVRFGTVEEAFLVFEKVPELEQYLNFRQLRERVNEGSLILISEADGHLTGFKIGYPVDDVEFYSWLGGVIPEFRELGFAQMMIEFQEQWSKEQGYKLLSVKSMNQFPSMLRLLVRNGYDIVRVDDYKHPKNERICLAKKLVTDN